MRQPNRYSIPFFVFAATLCCFDLPMAAQRQDRISSHIDNNRTVISHGNVHPMATPEHDIGRALPNHRMERMLLLLQPGVGEQQALDALVEDQQNPDSPYYRQWLTPEEFGRRFGVSDRDISQVVNWLGSQGFDVEPVPAGGRLVIFSGNVAQVESAFHTGIHAYRVHGELHHANSTSPQIPQALAGVVQGVVSLHDFRTQPQHRSSHLEASSPLDSRATPAYTGGGSNYLSPADLATIYDVNALYTGAFDGAGQTIAVVGRTNIQPSDVQTFRSEFGLPVNTPAILVNGTDPGIVSAGEQMEATLDVEWAGAMARKAAVTLVVSASTSTTDGVDLSAQYIVNKNLAAVMTTSFGSCEAAMGASENQFWNGLWQQAAAQGIAVMVASGDSGAAGCDGASAATARYGSQVNGLCSSPFSTCVGGTQFADTSNPGMYWSTANAPGTSGSALSYIPESAWNESASGGLWASGGGASLLYSKPVWQSGPGVPQDGHRDVPDVSLAAAGHDGYIVFMNGGNYIVSGTSAASPAFAGLMAVAAQKVGARLGNVNPTLYALAGKQASGGVAAFHDVTTGNNSVPGLTGYNATAGYDLATGLGSVDAAVLVNHWNDGSTPLKSFQLSAAPPSVSVTGGKSVTTVVRAAASGGFNAAVALSVSGLPSGLTAGFSPATVAAGSGSSTITLSAGAQIKAGIYPVTITGSGGGVNQALAFEVTIAASCSYSIDPVSANATASAGTYVAHVTTASNCAWSAVSNSSWISVTGSGSGTGNGSLSYSLAANTATAARSGSVTIAGLSFNVAQAAAPPVFSLSSVSASLSAAAATGTVAVATLTPNASWTAVSNASWIAVMAGAAGTGNKIVSYSAGANPATAARTGTLTIAGLTFTVTQAGLSCSYGVSPTSANPAAAGGSYSLQVTTASGCPWTAVSTSPSISVTGGASGTGIGTVNYSVSPNTGPMRSITLTVAGQSIVVTQAAAEKGPPIFVLSPASAKIGSTATNGSLAVGSTSPTASWTGVSNTNWITITSGALGSGNKNVSYIVTANTGTTVRSGTLTIAGHTFAITQAGINSRVTGSNR